METPSNLACYVADEGQETCRCCQRRAADLKGHSVLTTRTEANPGEQHERISVRTSSYPTQFNPMVSQTEHSSYIQSEHQPHETSKSPTQSSNLQDSHAIYDNGNRFQPSPIDKSESQSACSSRRQSQSSQSSRTDLLAQVEAVSLDPKGSPLPKGAPERKEWDIVLPRVDLEDPDDPFTPDEGITESFSIKRLVWGLQNGLNQAKLVQYLSYYEEHIIKQDVDCDIAGFPAIFYVVYKNDVDMLRTWISHGGNPNTVDCTFGFPLLAFAILNAREIGRDTTAVVTMLLALGADPTVIPKAFYSPYQQDLLAEDLSRASLPELSDPNKLWCKDYLRPKLARLLNLSQRYFLEKASRATQPSQRQRQIALEYKSSELLGISYFLIGQTWAARAVINKLLNYMVISSSRPLVLIFAGPSGHGKTELARRLGILLSLELEAVDMTEMKHENDLFGPKPPFVGASEGSPLNNFLVRMGGKRCIVFLDEFEKTTPEVHNSLLIPFDEGRYQDRRNRQRVDCSKVIWILATNALDPVIKSYCETNEGVIGYNEDNLALKTLMANLQKKMKDGLKYHFGAPLSGRISAVLPFLPFSLGEQAIVAHKFFLELAHGMQHPVCLNGPHKNLLGNVSLQLGRDWTTCRSLVEEKYDVDLGARSIRNLVRDYLEEPIVQRYLEENYKISEDQAREEYVVNMHKGEVTVIKPSDRG